MNKIKQYEVRLTEILDKLKQYQKEGKYTIEQISEQQEKLHKIDEEWTDGAIHEDDGSVAKGQAALSDLLSDAHELAADLLELIEDE